MKGKILSGVGLLGLFVALALLFLGGTEEPAEAGFTGESEAALVEYLEGGAPHNLKLMAIDALRKKSGTSADAALEELARGSDVRLAIASTTALGKRATSGSKAKLKSILEDDELGDSVRIGALTAIAEHFRDGDDLDYLDSESEGNSALRAQYHHVRSSVYGQ
jgi:hypothetical protein